MLRLRKVLHPSNTTASTGDPQSGKHLSNEGGLAQPATAPAAASPQVQLVTVAQPEKPTPQFTAKRSSQSQRSAVADQVNPPLIENVPIPKKNLA